MKLFHFLSEEYALKALKDQRLKVSRFSDFNDPFELTSMTLDDKFNRTVINENKKKIDNLFRVLCCSASWNSPLLWGHYGDKHKGVALELEVPSEAAEAIRYRESRENVDLEKLFSQKDNEAKRKFFELCTTKYIEWSYEDEYRVHLMDDEFYHDSGHDFFDLEGQIAIKGIIIGAMNKTLTRSDIQQVLPLGHEISVTTSRVAFKSFNIVQRKDKPTYVVKGES
ncbi:DUF2971 domain-containing protein [Marinomonas sp. PE14-40]|uniref:DUF2971 domain-containing protein n=1 Tax=Marinomonas sp. PE14-40 TaxID=3060621 RepID=UPI003F66B975